MLPLWDTNPHRRAPVMTVGLILANLFMFFHEWSLAAHGRLEPFLLEHALVPGRLLAHWLDGAEWLTVLTHMFLHGGIAHVVGNCWFLWVFGDNVEDRLGPGKFLIFYLLAGAAAAAVQAGINPGSAVPMIGASGAISGVLGAYLVLFPKAWIYTLVPWIVPIIPVPAFVFLAMWFVVQAFNGFGALFGGGLGGSDPLAGQGGVAWWAHAGGFAAGFAFVRRMISRVRW